LQAIISDIHGNYEALTAALADMDRIGVNELFCLGDVVGYGPSPRECLRAARNFKVCLKGNHEAALLNNADANDFNPHARIALEWTRDQVNSTDFDDEENKDIWNWIGDLDETYESDEFQLFHGSPRDPVREYVLPGQIKDAHRMEDLFSAFSKPLCFIGHSHVPGIYTQDMKFLTPEDVGSGFEPVADKTMINVGSIGQPRDGDDRSCYVTWDGEKVVFHRVKYDFKKTMDKILQIGVLPKILAFRLKEGR